VAEPNGIHASGPRLWIALTILTACALVPYVGTWSYGFVDRDDSVGIVELPLIRQLSLRTLPDFFRGDVYPWLPEYMPLKNLSYAVDYALFGLWAPGFRIQQQLWYLANVLLLWLWLRALLRRLADAQRLGTLPQWADRIALLTAALFALHPVHVESVTWLSGRKDLLSGAFSLAALGCAFAWNPSTGRRATWLLLGALLSTALALLAKPMAVILPALMLLQDYVCGAPRQDQHAWLRKRAPLYIGSFALALAFAGLYWSIVRDYSNASRDLEPFLYRGPGYARVGQQLAAFAYLVVMPGRLAPMYPPDQLATDPRSLRALLGMLAVLMLIAGAIWTLRRRHPLALALGLFVIPLAPILISPPWGQYVAGRYLFLSVVGPILGLVWLAARALSSRAHLRWAGWTALGLVALGLLASTLDYNRSWRDSLSLWARAIEKHPQFTAYYDYAATAAVRAHEPELAASILEACLEIDTDDAPCNTGLGALWANTRPELAQRHLQRALPRDLTGRAHLVLALQLAASGHGPEALNLYETWLNGRVVGADDLFALARVALLAQQPRRAWHAVQQAVRLGAERFPAAEPPAALLTEIARARADAALVSHVQTVLAQCTRMDCARRAFGW
jgi:tetratricopeptide (TPR) repeat protein